MTNVSPVAPPRQAEGRRRYDQRAQAIAPSNPSEHRLGRRPLLQRNEMADSTSHAHGVAFGRIAAAIPVSDLCRALDFYQGVLGMSVTFTNGDPAGFAILKRDAAELHLTLVKGHKSGSHNAAHLMVADAASLYDHLASNGVRIVKGLRDANYGLRGFVFADPDGNRIDVGQRLT
jgi:catechol 2,3-dioxygenase-like lactoylglutathione lyase family enzyme